MIGSCGCFGREETPPHRSHVVLDAGLAGLAALDRRAVARRRCSTRSPTRPATAAGVVALSAVALYLLYAAFVELPRTLTAGRPRSGLARRSAPQLLDLIQKLWLGSAACRRRPPRRCSAQHGMHVTAQRLAVLQAVSDLPHSTADDIYTAVRAELGAISRQTVYDALAALTDRGLVPSHPARRLVGPLRDPGRRQPPPPRVPHLRPDGRRRLRGGRHPVPDGRRRLRLRDRRSRGRVLGPLPRLRSRGPVGRGPRAVNHSKQPPTQEKHRRV